MTTHHGSCHCGATTYSVATDLKKVINCNCSYCAKKGLILTFVPESQFTLHTGAENLTEYRFNTKRIAHLFCKTCGVQCFGKAQNQDGATTVAINVRTIPDLSLDTLTITPVNGKDY